MTTGSTGTKRRTLLQRGIALLAGGAAIAGGTRWAAAASPPGTAPMTMTLYARKRPVAGATPDGRIVASGDLFDRPGGERIGSFHSNCFCAQSPFTHRSFGDGGFGVHAAGPSLEFHVLQLKDGTLFSVGNAGGDDGVRPLAIIGGTDAFAGRSGAWIERTVAGEHATDDMRELTITFAG